MKTVFGLLGSTLSVVSDVADIVAAPVKVAVDAAKEIIEPLADASREVVGSQTNKREE